MQKKERIVVRGADQMHTSGVITFGQKKISQKGKKEIWGVRRHIGGQKEKMEAERETGIGDVGGGLNSSVAGEKLYFRRERQSQRVCMEEKGEGVHENPVVGVRVLEKQRHMHLKRTTRRAGMTFAQKGG